MAEWTKRLTPNLSTEMTILIILFCIFQMPVNDNASPRLPAPPQSSLQMSQSVIAQQLATPPMSVNPIYNLNQYQSVRLSAPPVYTGNQVTDIETRNQSTTQHSQSVLPVKIDDCVPPQSNLQQMLPTNHLAYGNLQILPIGHNQGMSLMESNANQILPPGPLPLTNTVEILPQYNEETNLVPVSLVPNYCSFKVQMRDVVNQTLASGTIPTSQQLTDQGNLNITATVPAGAFATHPAVLHEKSATFDNRGQVRTENMNHHFVLEPEQMNQQSNTLQTPMQVLYMVEKPQNILATNQTALISNNETQIPLQSSGVVEMSGGLNTVSRTAGKLLLPRSDNGTNTVLVSDNGPYSCDSGLNQSSVLIPKGGNSQQGYLSQSHTSCSEAPSQVPESQTSQEQPTPVSGQDGFPTQLHITYQTNSAETGQPVLQHVLLPHGEIITLNLGQLSAASQLPGTSQLPAMSQLAQVEKQVMPHDSRSQNAIIATSDSINYLSHVEQRESLEGINTMSTVAATDRNPVKIAQGHAMPQSNNTKVHQRKEREIKPHINTGSNPQKTRFLSGGNIRKTKSARSTGARSITPHTGLRVTFEDNNDAEIKTLHADTFQDWESKLKPRHYSGNSDLGNRSRKSSGNSLFSDTSFHSVFPFSNLSSPNIFHDKDRGIFFIQSLDGMDLNEIEPSPTWEDMYQSGETYHMTQSDNALDNHHQDNHHHGNHHNDNHHHANHLHDNGTGQNKLCEEVTGHSGDMNPQMMLHSSASHHLADTDLTGSVTTATTSEYLPTGKTKKMMMNVKSDTGGHHKSCRAGHTEKPSSSQPVSPSTI